MQVRARRMAPVSCCTSISHPSQGREAHWAAEELIRRGLGLPEALLFERVLRSFARGTHAVGGRRDPASATLIA